ncbi:MAG: LPS export ABC transporter periplasmic protein LptC [Spirochaetales bacterium]|nr:LPS export ABC transporter periplasmic protein LptC [Spirochaetales bacterium]
MKKNNLFYLSIISTILFISGCSLDYSSANLAEDLSEKVPETVFLNFSQTQVKDGKITNKIEAERAESYTKKKEMIMEYARFQELDENGDIQTEGKADRAVLYTETDDADLFGNVYFYSYTEKTSIYADTLYWKDRDEKLLGDPGAKVLVKKDDGSYIEGKGFSTDFKLREITFTNGVNGKYIKAEDETE